MVMEEPLIKYLQLLLLMPYLENVVLIAQLYDMAYNLPISVKILCLLNDRFDFTV